MNPIEARERILAQHASLRVRLGRVEGLSRQASSNDLEATARLIWELEELKVEMEEHLAQEELLLGPVLKDTGAWGRIRFDWLQRGHVDQREVLESLVSGLDALAPEDTAQVARTLVRAILADMDDEERDLLSPDSLAGRGDAAGADKVGE